MHGIFAERSLEKDKEQKFGGIFVSIQSLITHYQECAQIKMGNSQFTRRKAYFLNNIISILRLFERGLRFYCNVAYIFIYLLQGSKQHHVSSLQCALVPGVHDTVHT